MLTTELRGVARRQHGLLTRSQILSGLTRHRLATSLEAGILENVRPGVYRIGGAPETWEQMLLAACLCAGPGTVASFRAAARLWGLEGFLEGYDVEVTTPTRRRSRLPGAIVHDSFILTKHHVTRRAGVPVTTPARTLCDLTACCAPWDVERAVDEALRRRLTTLRSLTTVFLDLAHKGRRRSTIMRAILEDRVPGFEPGESNQEMKLIRWLRGAGLPKLVAQHRVRIGKHSYRLDLAFPSHMVGIEYDGWEAHRARSSFDRDRERDNDLQSAGWMMLHFTSRSRRSDVVGRVRNALQNREHVT